MNHKLFLSKEEESADSVCNLKGNSACDKTVVYFSNRTWIPKILRISYQINSANFNLRSKKSQKNPKASVGLSTLKTCHKRVVWACLNTKAVKSLERMLIITLCLFSKMRLIKLLINWNFGYKLPLLTHESFQNKSLTLTQMHKKWKIWQHFMERTKLLSLKVKSIYMTLT